MANLWGAGGKLLMAGALFLLGRADCRRRRVLNSHLFFFSLLSLTLALGSGRLSGKALLWWGITSGLLYLLFALRKLGAGDGKVLSASALYGFAVADLGFLLPFFLLICLDRLAAYYLRAKGKEEAPLLWLWAWAFWGWVVFDLLKNILGIPLIR